MVVRVRHDGCEGCRSNRQESELAFGPTASAKRQEQFGTSVCQSESLELELRKTMRARSDEKPIRLPVYQFVLSVASDRTIAEVAPLLDLAGVPNSSKCGQERGFSRSAGLQKYEVPQGPFWRRIATTGYQGFHQLTNENCEGTIYNQGGD